MARQRDIVTARQQARIGERTRLIVDGRSPEHELVMQGRLPGQAPEIDPVVYLTDCDPSAIEMGALIDVEIVGAESYDLVARPLQIARPEAGQDNSAPTRRSQRMSGGASSV